MADYTSVILTSFHPFPSLSLHLPSSTPLSSLPQAFSPLLPVASQSLSSRSGRRISSRSDGTVGELAGGKWVELRLVPKVLGGKGGFGSQLRAAGGRMSSHKASNNDSCRDLNGRRLSTIKEAKKLAASIASEPEREALARKKAEERLAALNQEIARLDAAVNGGAGGSGAGSKRRLDDAEEGEKREEAKEKLRGAVASAMLKKRKKNKPSPPAASTSASSSSAAKAVEESTKAPAVAAV